MLPHLPLTTCTLSAGDHDVWLPDAKKLPASGGNLLVRSAQTRKLQPADAHTCNKRSWLGVTCSLSAAQVYLTGHGGEDFLKFNDKEELTSAELAAAVEGAHSNRGHAHVLLIIDTCQAATLVSQLRIPSLLAVASSGSGVPAPPGSMHEGAPCEP